MNGAEPRLLSRSRNPLSNALRPLERNSVYEKEPSKA